MCPNGGIGERTVDLAAQIGQQVGESLFTVLTHPKDYPAISRAANKVAPFVSMMEEFLEKNQGGQLLPSELYGELLERLQYEEYLKQDEPDKAEERMENVQELSSMLRRYEEEAGGRGQPLRLFGGSFPVHRPGQLRPRTRTAL